jgi:hypothetical protein
MVNRIVELVVLSSVLRQMGSTQPQLIQAEREALAICEQQGASHSREDGIIEGRLDSQPEYHRHPERQ